MDLDVNGGAMLYIGAPSRCQSPISERARVRTLAAIMKETFRRILLASLVGAFVALLVSCSPLSPTITSVTPEYRATAVGPLQADLGAVTPTIAEPSPQNVYDRKGEIQLAKASDLVDRAKQAEEVSYAEAADLYVRAYDEAQLILTEYLTSSTALELLEGDGTIGGYSLADLKNEIIPAVTKKAAAEQDILTAALWLAENASEGGRDFALTDVARAHAQIGDYARGLEIIEKLVDEDTKDYAIRWASYTAKEPPADQSSIALHMVDSLEASADKVAALTNIAVDYAVVGRRGQAENVIRNATIAVDALDAQDKDQARELIVEALVEMREPEQAMEVAQVIEDTRHKSSALHSVSWSLAMAGDLDQSLHVAEMIQDDEYRESLLSRIAGQFAANDRMAEAVQIADTIQAADHYADALAGVASGYTHQGNESKATTYFAEAIQATSVLTAQEHLDYKVTSLLYIGSKYLEIGQSQHAKELIDMAEDVVAAMSTTNRSRGYRATTLAYWQAKVGQHQEALDTAHSVEDDRLRHDVLNEIALLYLENGERQRTTEILSSMLGDVSAIGNPSDQVSLLAEIGAGFHRAKLPLDQAAQAFLHRLIREKSK